MHSNNLYVIKILATVARGYRSRYEGPTPYRTLSTANQASSPASKLHPIGPRSHSAQIRNFTFPFASAIPGACGGSVISDEREKPIFSKAKGEPGMCQYAVCEGAESSDMEMEGDGGKGPSTGIYIIIIGSVSRIILTAPPSATTHSPTSSNNIRLPHSFRQQYSFVLLVGGEEEAVVRAFWGCSYSENSLVAELGLCFMLVV